MPPRLPAANASFICVYSILQLFCIFKYIDTSNFLPLWPIIFVMCSFLFNITSPNLAMWQRAAVYVACCICSQCTLATDCLSFSCSSWQLFRGGWGFARVEMAEVARIPLYSAFLCHRVAYFAYRVYYLPHIFCCPWFALFICLCIFYFSKLNKKTVAFQFIALLKMLQKFHS